VRIEGMPGGGERLRAAGAGLGLSEPAGMKRYVIALILLIAGAIGLAVPLLTRDSSEPADTVRATPQYSCSQCRKEFALTPQERFRQRPDPETIKRDRTAARWPHCPLCGGKHVGRPMVTCPGCGKSYVPFGALRTGLAGAGPRRDVCPHCKTDRAQWYRSRRSR